MQRKQYNITDTDMTTANTTNLFAFSQHLTFVAVWPSRFGKVRHALQRRQSSVGVLPVYPTS